MGKILDLKGQRFGKLVVLSDPILKPRADGRNSSYFLCECHCGERKEIKGSSLLSSKGGTKSCGCLQRQKLIKRNLKHGQAKVAKTSRTYVAWGNMKARCKNKNLNCFNNYGGRGITYDPRWEDFEQFYKDMGECPLGYQLERIDVEGNYCKENCIWATQDVQSNNKRTCVNITFNNKTQTLAQWAKELGIHKSTLRSRLFDLGWSIEEAFRLPPDVLNRFR